jgi:hypothetical protein
LRYSRRSKGFTVEVARAAPRLRRWWLLVGFLCSITLPLAVRDTTSGSRVACQGCAVAIASPGGSAVVGLGAGPVSLPPQPSRTDPGPALTGARDVDESAEALRGALTARGHADAFVQCVRNELAHRFEGTERQVAVRLLAMRDASADQVVAVVRDGHLDAGRSFDLPGRIGAIEDLCRSFDAG